MGILWYFCVTIWNAMATMFGAAVKAKEDSDGWADVDTRGVGLVDASPIAESLNQGFNEFGIAAAITQTVANTVGRVIYRVNVKTGVKQLPDELL